MKELHFTKADPFIGEEGPLEEVSLIFDQEYCKSIPWSKYKLFQQNEAEEIYASLRVVMPQGVLDKLGALIMTELCSDLIIASIPKKEE